MKFRIIYYCIICVVKYDNPLCIYFLILQFQYMKNLFTYSSFQSKVSESAESVEHTHCHYIKARNLQTILGRDPMGGGGVYSL